MKTKRLKSLKLSIMLFILVFVVNACVYMTKNMFAAAMAFIVEEGVMTKSQTGTISAGFWLVYGIFQFLGGFAADKFSPYKLIMIGLISGIVSNLIIYYNQSYFVVMAVWCINAAFQFGLWPGSFKIVSTQMKLEFRDTAIFWILLSTSVGQALSMIIASCVNFWQQNFIVSAIVLTVILVLWSFLYKAFEIKMEDGSEHFTGTKEIPLKETIGMKELILKSGLPVLFLISFLINTTANGMKTVTPVMLMESYDALPAAIANRLGVILIVFATLGMFLSNIFRSKVTKNEMKGASILLFISVPALILSVFIEKIHYAFILVFLSFAMMFVQGALPFANTFASARFTYCGKSGTVSGILNAALAMGNVLSSYLFSKMAEHFPWNTVTAVWAGAIALAAITTLLMIRFWTIFIKKTKI